MPFVLGNCSEKLDDEDLEYTDELVRFTEQGESLKGWVIRHLANHMQKEHLLKKRKNQEEMIRAHAEAEKNIKSAVEKIINSRITMTLNFK